MSTRLARTADGWWLVTPAGLSRLALDAPTTGRLLAGRAALDAAVQAAQGAAAAAACAAWTASSSAARSASSPAVVAAARPRGTRPAGVTTHQPSAVRARLALMSSSP